MVSIKSIAHGIVFVISGLAIVVVGGFMMIALARLWLPRNKKEKNFRRSEEKEKTD